jgi:hypothetical protein
MPVTPLKRIRVDDTLWQRFGDATTSMGADRTKVLVAFMRNYISAVTVVRSTEGAPSVHPPHSAS